MKTITDKNSISTYVNKIINTLPEKIKNPINNFKSKRYRKRRIREKFNEGYRVVPEQKLADKHQEIINWLKEDGNYQFGDYFEFGVFVGTSMGCMYKALTNNNLNQVRLFGFDSFEGLPASSADEDQNTWSPGMFSSDMAFTKKNLDKLGVNWEKVKLIKGWFNETLNPELIENYNIKKASIIMVDCDYYSSSKEALNFCVPLIKDKAVIIFDDWNSMDLAQKNLGEKKAFDEILAEHPSLSVEDFGNYNKNSQVFKVFRNK